VTEVRRLELPDVLEIRPHRHEDARGFFSEVWRASDMAEHGLPTGFVQDNHSFSVERGVLRGLHYQLPPFAQDKLVRVARGSVYDVAVDIRPGSATFGRWVGLHLSAEKWNQIFVPKGFAHGFVTLEPNTEVLYKVTAPYAREHDRSLYFGDPELAIEWPVPADELRLSEKDRHAPRLAEIEPIDWGEVE
jgi:dTDP-4-dehydrorhamnose 3,5-epimerase